MVNADTQVNTTMPAMGQVMAGSSHLAAGDAARSILPRGGEGSAADGRFGGRGRFYESPHINVKPQYTELSGEAKFNGNRGFFGGFNWETANQCPRSSVAVRKHLLRIVSVSTGA